MNKQPFHLAATLGGILLTQAVWAGVETITADGRKVASGFYAVPESRWRVGASIGWAGVNLDELGGSMTAEAADVNQIFTQLFYGDGRVTSKTTKGGLNVEGEIGYALTEHIGIGGRLGWFQPGEMAARGDAQGTYRGHDAFSAYSDSVSLLLVPLLMGGWIESSEDESGLRAWGSLFFGPAIARGEFRHQYQVTVPALSIREGFNKSVLFTGRTFAVEIGGGLNKVVTKHFAVFIEAGYRLANVMHMTAAQDVDFNDDGVVDVKKGERYTNSKNQPVQFDFSGFKVNLSLRSAF